MNKLIDKITNMTFEDWIACLLKATIFIVLVKVIVEGLILG